MNAHSDHGVEWKRLGRAALGIIGIVALAGMFWAFYLQSKYQSALPKREDVAAGRIYPLNVHGIVVWQTRNEDRTRKQIEYSSVVVLFAVVFVQQLFRRALGISSGRS